MSHWIRTIILCQRRRGKGTLGSRRQRRLREEAWFRFSYLLNLCIGDGRIISILQHSYGHIVHVSTFCTLVIMSKNGVWGKVCLHIFSSWGCWCLIGVFFFLWCLLLSLWAGGIYIFSLGITWAFGSDRPLFAGLCLGVVQPGLGGILFAVLHAFG